MQVSCAAPFEPFQSHCQFFPSTIWNIVTFLTMQLRVTLHPSSGHTRSGSSWPRMLAMIRAASSQDVSSAPLEGASCSQAWHLSDSSRGASKDEALCSGSLSILLD